MMDKIIKKPFTQRSGEEVKLMHRTGKNRLRSMTEEQLEKRFNYLKSKRTDFSKSNAMKYIEYQLKKRFGKETV